MQPPPRKVKVTQELKHTHAEQMSRLHIKHQTECDLLEDLRTFSQKKAAVERDYAQCIDQLMLVQAELQDSVKELAKTRKKYQETEAMAQAVRDKAEQDAKYEQYMQTYTLYVQSQPPPHPPTTALWKSEDQMGKKSGYISTKPIGGKGGAITVMLPIQYSDVQE
uniref:FCH and double SH3 domains 2 n=1 Tax=Hucho hucho TaxID=62062 RepID=A0A4W5Q944_9TELE